MFHFTKGKKDGFTTLSEQHYQNLRMERQLTKSVTRYAGSILSLVDDAAVDKGGDNHTFFADLLAEDYKWLKTILTGTPGELQEVIDLFEARILIGTYPRLTAIVDGEEVPSDFAKMIKTVFDYKHFSGKSARYSAYHFCQPMGMDVCPYCNRNYTLTVYYRGGGLIRPELDHYVPKSKYPYLALSFYNLIPSCHLCNANLKHASPMNFKDFIHPYEHSLHEIFKFSAVFKNKKELKATEIGSTFGTAFFAGETDSFDVKIKFRPGVPFSMIKKAANNARVFKLQKIYNEHKDLIEEMIIGAAVYSDTYIDTLYNDFQGSLFSSREDVLRLLTHNYSSKDEMSRRPFSKLTKDIFSEFGLKYSSI
ncbi:hypothetical protein [Pedobacter gandavensis]|uniref:HNH endonuclease n=1 Tax=Pedobacter gandavensis TaxID=2679963 RepID=UPI00293100EE|nr:hypothetical protein [Pedobacter gandavensis]